jgi:hypothetical protein
LPSDQASKSATTTIEATPFPEQVVGIFHYPDASSWLPQYELRV